MTTDNIVIATGTRPEIPTVSFFLSTLFTLVTLDILKLLLKSHCIIITCCEVFRFWVSVNYAFTWERTHLNDDDDFFHFDDDDFDQFDADSIFHLIEIICKIVCELEHPFYTRATHWWPDLMFLCRFQVVNLQSLATIYSGRRRRPGKRSVSFLKFSTFFTFLL